MHQKFDANERNFEIAKEGEEVVLTKFNRHIINSIPLTWNTIQRLFL